MSVFAVLTDQGNSALENAIQATFPKESLKIRPGQFLVSTPGTAIDLSNKLHITKGENGSGIVLTISSYYGRADVAIWEWVKAKWSEPGA